MPESIASPGNVRNDNFTFFEIILQITPSVQFRAFKQMATATPTSAVAAADSRGEYVTVARQISTLSKRYLNSVYGVFGSLLSLFVGTLRSNDATATRTSLKK